MIQVKGFTLNKKGFCIVNAVDGVYLYTPNKTIKDVDLPQLKNILVSEAGSTEDVGMVEDILSICNSWRRDNVLHSTIRG